MMKTEAGREIYESGEGIGYYKTPAAPTHTAQTQSAKTNMAEAAKT
jgi:hypothetical protein